MRRGFFHKQRRDKKQRVLEKTEPALRLGLGLIAGDDFDITELLAWNVAPDHIARPQLLGVIDALGIRQHLGFNLPLGGLDWGARGGAAFVP